MERQCDLQVVWVFRYQFLSAFSRLHLDTTLMIGALNECSLFGGDCVFTDALSQWPGAILLFLEALADPSVMRVRLHHSQGNFHRNVWAWRSGGSGKPVLINHRCFTCIQAAFGTKGENSWGHYSGYVVYKEYPHTQLPCHWRRWFWWWMSQDFWFNEWVWCSRYIVAFIACPHCSLA